MDKELQLKLLDSAISELEGVTASKEEVKAMRESLVVFKASIEKNLTWFLENMSRIRAVVGMVLARTEKVYGREKAKLDKVFSREYNNHRSAGMSSKMGKAPPADALKHIVRGGSEYDQQSKVVSRAEFHRNVVRELNDALSTRSREVDQICNNMRLEFKLSDES